MSKYENVETVIDRFLDYIKTNKKTKLSEVAGALGIKEEQAERIALLLEQASFVELQYNVGSVTVSIKTVPIAQSDKKEEGVEVTKSKAVVEGEELERQVLTAENLLKFFEKDISRRVSIAEKLLVDLEKQKNVTPEDVKEVESEIDLALSQLAAFSSEVKDLADMEEHFYNRLTHFREKLNSFKKGQKIIEEVTLIEKIIIWIKKLFASFKNKRRKRIVLRKEKAFDRAPKITFLGKKKLSPKPKRTRVLELRSDKIKQHYWRKRKSRV